MRLSVGLTDLGLAIRLSGEGRVSITTTEYFQLEDGLCPLFPALLLAGRRNVSINRRILQYTRLGSLIMAYQADDPFHIEGGKDLD